MHWVYSNPTYVPAPGRPVFNFQASILIYPIQDNNMPHLWVGKIQYGYVKIHALHINNCCI